MAEQQQDGRARRRGRPYGARNKHGTWDPELVLELLMVVATRPESALWTRWRVVRRCAEELYPAIYGPEDSDTAKKMAVSPGQKRQLKAKIDALHRRVEREQADVESSHLAALGYAHDKCEFIDDSDQDWSDYHGLAPSNRKVFDHKLYEQEVEEIHRRYPVLPQGFQPTVIKSFGIQMLPAKLGKTG